MLGLSADEVLAYQTLKIVKIKDYRLGGVYYSFIFLIALWVLGYQIIYSNDHFVKLDVSGNARVTIQQPTVGACNPGKPDCKSAFRNLTELPYCKEYIPNGTSTDVIPQRPCMYADRHTMNPHGMAHEGLFVPTRIDTIVESRGCTPSAANSYSCDNEWNIEGSSGVVYVADVDRSTLMIAHSYGRNDIQGDSRQIIGSYLECASGSSAGVDPRVEVPLEEKRWCEQGREKKRIECLGDKCPFLPEDPKVKEVFLQLQRQSFASQRKARRRGSRLGAGTLALEEVEKSASGGDEEDFKKSLVQGGIFAIPNGDIISMSKLLEIAGVDLDKTLDADGAPARESGTVIEVNVVYTNLHPFSSTFGNKAIEYYYDIHQVPVSDFKTEFISYDKVREDTDASFPALAKGDDQTTRHVENRHGIGVVVKVSGTFGFFSPTYLLVMLTTACGLLAAATFMTDKLAIYVAKDEKYLEAMIDSTEELNKDGPGPMGRLLTSRRPSS
mmetsp:Transcript_126131/g.315234  ORF Transcript_126131/g.315234 Transcript_126131/m.315234 type:complete len:498 (+) Transcript_126131:149-1642(+)